VSSITVPGEVLKNLRKGERVTKVLDSLISTRRIYPYVKIRIVQRGCFIKDNDRWRRDRDLGYSATVQVHDCKATFNHPHLRPLLKMIADFLRIFAEG